MADAYSRFRDHPRHAAALRERHGLLGAQSRSELARSRGPPVTAPRDGQQTECEAVYVAKGRFFAGRWSFAPEASVGEPLLHVITLGEASRTRFLLFAWALLRHRPVEQLAGVHCFACTELTMRSDAAPPLQGDGDILACLPLSITLAAEAIHFA